MARSLGRVGIVCAAVTVCLGLAAPSGITAQARTTARAGASAEAALRHYQAGVLDPQADRGQHVLLPDPSTARPSNPLPAYMPLPKSVGGMWKYGVPFDAKFNAIHEIASSNGRKILLVAGSGNSAADFAAGTFRSFVWIPSTGVRREVPTPKDVFCSGHVLLPDGRALVVGGTGSYGTFTGTKTLYAFNFTTEHYDQLTDMQVGRWYPSVINGADGRTLLVSGLGTDGKVTNVAEVFDYRTNQTTVLAGSRTFSLYPRMFLAADGRYFYTGTPTGGGAPPGFWEPFTSNALQQVTGLAVPSQRTASTSCFVGDVRDQNVMVMGGGWPATDSTSVIKLDDPQPAYRDGPPLLASKAYLSCLNLPDGTLFEANGGTANTIEGASTEAAFLPSVSGPWTSANPLPDGEHRVYHSLLFLLNNGKVVSMTSNPQGEARSISLLMYSPPYLFKGTRPVITDASREMAHGGTYPVGTTATGATVDRITLTAASSPTHGSDNNQRYASLPLTDGQITIPESRTILPPGWYRLWAVDSLGRVSVCTWVHLDL